MKQTEKFKIVKEGVQFYRTMKDWLGEGGKPVPIEQAQRRADKCLQCPFNVNPGGAVTAFKGIVAGSLVAIVRAKNKLSLEVEGEDRLHLCTACKCVLPLKIHVPLKHIEETTYIQHLKNMCKEYNVTCWILEERKTTTP